MKRITPRHLRQGQAPCCTSVMPTFKRKAEGQELKVSLVYTVSSDCVISLVSKGKERREEQRGGEKSRGEENRREERRGKGKKGGEYGQREQRG